MKSIKKKGPVFRILSFLKSRKKMVVFLVFLVVLNVGFDVSVPLISKRLIDALVNFFKNGGESPLSILIFSAVGILLATILGKISDSTYGYYLFRLVTKIQDSLGHTVFEKYLRLHTLFHHRSSSGQVIGRIDRGGAATFNILYDVIGQNLLPSLAMFSVAFVVLITKNLWIALAVFAPLPIYLLAVKRLTSKVYSIEKSANEKFEAVSKEAYDVAGNVLTVKKFSQEEAEVKNQIKLREEAREIQYNSEKTWTIIENLQTLISTFGRVGVILLAGFFVLRGVSTIGDFVFYMTLQNMVYNPLTRLSFVFPKLRRNGARVEPLFEILDEPVRIFDKSEALSLPLFAKNIEFKDVWFRYAENTESGNWALKNINVNIPVGNTTALVGRSGSGKTTFINLLLRSYDPQKGAVLVDGNDLRNIKRKSLLNQIAVVPQEVDLFSRTIAQNIAYGKPDMRDEDIINAAKTALAHDFIVATEKGYKTVVGERGIKLSGGERQRIGIARALLRDPRILILDEATSHLDSESERLIVEATDALIKDRTTFIIAHRLSTILNADMILVFNEGEIVAKGKHEELLKTSPIYKKLYSLQFSDA